MHSWAFYIWKTTWYHPKYRPATGDWRTLYQP